ncbi:MAG: hypothetical protein ACFFCI_07990 [Promethearchaeota archaeon]
MFWYISVQAFYQFLSECFFKNRRAAIIVFNLEDNTSEGECFQHISDLNDDIRKNYGDNLIVLSANEVDLVDENDIDHSAIHDIVEKNDYLG